MDTQALKTQAEQAEFVRRLTEIVKDNDELLGKYKVAFPHSGAFNEVMIRDHTGHAFNIVKLMTKREYAAYVALRYWWNK